MSPTERLVLRAVRATPTSELVDAYQARTKQATIETAMDDRWLALAILAELFRRDEIHLLPSGRIADGNDERDAGQAR